MDARKVEGFIGKRLKRTLGKQISVIGEPVAITKFSGIKPEVFVFVSNITDFDGLMPDGAHTARRPVKGESTYKGFEEERPARITLTVSCLAGNYKLLHEICNLVTPATLLALELLPRFTLGSLPDDSVELFFEDFTSNLHTADYSRLTQNNTPFFKADLVFYMNGFIKMWLTKRGGFLSKSTSRPKMRKKPHVSKSKVKVTTNSFL
jgi:hypothetical protein